MIVKRKLYANITNKHSLSAVKSTINHYAKKSSGIHNKTISSTLKKAAKSVYKVTGDNVNGFIVDNSGNRIGNTVYTNVKKKSQKASKNLWSGDLFDKYYITKVGKKHKSIPKTKNNSQSSTTCNDNFLRKLQEKRKFDRMLKRNYQTEIGKDGLVTGKLTKTDGSSRIIMKNQSTFLTDPNFTKGTGFEIN